MGKPYWPARKAFVVTQDGVGCTFAEDHGRTGAEILTHEVGHALGLGHSCEGRCSSQEADATMYAFAHEDGRGASIRADDRAVAAVVYPDPSYVFGSGFEP